MPRGGHDRETADASVPQPAAAPRKRPLRNAIAARLWWLLAYVSLAVGIVGIFVPGLPTTVFVLVAAYAASRGSERLHRWLHAHPRFGPAIRDWQAHGAVSRRAKWAATWAMLGCTAVLLATMHVAASHRAWMVALPVACMAVVALWLWRRPEPPR